MACLMHSILVGVLFYCVYIALVTNVDCSEMNGRCTLKRPTTA